MKPYLLAACLDDYIEQHLKPARADVVRAGYARDSLVDFFGADRDVQTLTRKDGRKYRAKRLKDGVTDSTIRRDMGFGMSAFRFAAEEEKIGAVPVWKLPPEGAAREVWFTEDQVVKILEQPMSEPMRLAIYIALGTGARREAIVTLPVGRVDLKGGFIDFRDPKKPVTRKRRVKTKMSDWLVPLLSKACEGKAPADLVLGGNPKTPKHNARRISDEFGRILKALGLHDKGVGLHCIRRTFVVWSLTNGATMASVSAATGDNVATLEKHYIAYLPEHTSGATSAIPDHTKGINNAE